MKSIDIKLALLGLLILFLAPGCHSDGQSVDSPASMYDRVQVGMTEDQVIDLLGDHARVLNRDEVYGVHEQTEVLWYYPLELAEEDFDTHQFVVEFDRSGQVRHTSVFSN